MTYAPNANWTAAAAEAVQEPVYFLRIAGHTSEDFATADVKSASTTKTVCAMAPTGGAFELEPLDGTYQQANVTMELLDVDGAITSLISTDVPGSGLTSLINRTATIYGGYRSLDESDYPAIYTGVIAGLTMNRDRTGYVLEIASLLRRLDGEIMSDATSDTPATIRGNPVNIYWSLLSGTFSTSHATFPLDAVSSASTSSSAPTGLNITSSELNTTMMTTERDRWYPDAVAEVVYNDATSARAELETEFFRVWQCFPAISGDGRIGLKFLLPPLPASSAQALTDDDIVEVYDWARLMDQHLNQFLYRDELTKGSGNFDQTLYSTETAEDTADQAATSETIQYRVDSRWLSGTYNGVTNATVLAGRTRVRYLRTPAKVEVGVPFTMRHIEHGDVVAVTCSSIPDLRAGTMGTTGRLMLVSGLAPDFERGLLRLTLLDVGYRRYGVIAPAGTADYTSATAPQQEMFAWISDGTTETMSDGDMGYRVI